ncbi:hypothetical protein WHR41_09096 [Cladosporium halotolerans]|uniref:Transcription factor Rba50 n=1 Tax=Cladosporium halotolerans TaxID=1052096 RepID=A0AB34KBL1_9PEZI
MFRGEKFVLDVDDDDAPQAQHVAPSPFTFVGDIQERKPTAPAPPSAPTPKHRTGFPEHRKRPVQSRFKQQKQQGQKTVLSDGTTVTPGAQAPATKTKPSEDSAPRSWQEQEKTQIDQQNRDMLAGMSESEIEEARAELLGSLDPDFIQKILRRSNIDSGSNEADTLKPPPEPIEGGILHRETPAKTKSVAFAADDPPPAPQPTAKDETDEAAITIAHEPDFPPETNAPLDPPSDTIHFPTPTQPPALDPASPSFLTDLHEKYFPSLPADPTKLDWMRPPSPSSNSSYSPAAAALNPASIRFSFTGALLAPRTAAAIPVSEGLHHHGAAPDAAGYTIAELALLARSTYAAQRCVAFQTLGRILFRLGRGEFGDAGEEGGNLPDAQDRLGELARGLWREVEREHVIPQLVAESEGNGVDGGRHLSAKTYAVEAVWLWRKGGGRRWKAD